MATAKEKEKKVVDMLSNHKTAMLVTHDKQGGLVSRPMTTQNPKFDGTVWFFVSSDAEMIEEIEANSDVNIAYTADKSQVSLSGKASIVDDDQKKKEMWYPELKKWFDGAGPESPKVKLIKVVADTARYWDMSNADSKQNDSPIEEGKVDY